MPVLLAIDDDRLILDCLGFAFEAGEVDLVTATTVAEGLAAFERRRPDVVLLDVQLPDMSGLEAFRKLRQIDARVPVIVMTGQGTAETAIEAMRLGAYDYIAKPVDPDHLVEQVRRAFEISRLMRVPAVLSAAEAETQRGDVLIGNCPAMREVYKAIGRVAPQDVGVLILGESGTGKEMVARAIYHYSKRAQGPFLAINCAAIPETLLESELFGHEKGAFTGADRRRIGKFEQCNGGTLFLDEIGDMTPLTQTKILRVLQDGAFERVGGNETIKTDVRILAATNRDLEKLMAEGQFRADLFYRLNVYTIQLPPLRDRLEDLPLLVEHFLKRFGTEMGKQMPAAAPETLAILGRQEWPGNIRQLQSTLKQALVQGTGPVLLPDFLPEAMRGEGAGQSAAVPLPADDDPLPGIRMLIRKRLQEEAADLYHEVIIAVERLLLTDVLQHTGGNQSQASRILGITRQTLRNKLEALGLHRGGDEES